MLSLLPTLATVHQLANMAIANSLVSLVEQNREALMIRDIRENYLSTHTSLK